MSPESSPEEPPSRLGRAVAGSRILAVLQALDDRLATVGRDSPATRLAARTRRVVTASVLYRWLTAEPDPEVVVIDLRETSTVGPLVAALDRVVGRLDDATTDARTTALARGLHGEVRAAPVRLVGVVVAVACALALLAGSALGTLAPLHAVVLAVLALAGLAGTRVTASWTDLVDSRVGRLAVAALDPPSPDESPTAVSDSDDEGQS
jgi:hypothetical protein